MRAEPELRAALSNLDRRGFLRLTGAAAAAGLLPAGCGHAADVRPPPADLELAVLTPRTYTTFGAAASCIVGPRGGALITSGEIDVGRRADASLTRLPEVSGLIQQALLLLEFGVHPLIAKLRPFTALATDERNAVLRNLMHSRLGVKRSLFKAVRSFSWMAFYGDPGSHAGIHYPGPFGDDAVSVKDAMTYPIES